MRLRARPAGRPAARSATTSPKRSCSTSRITSSRPPTGTQRVPAELRVSADAMGNRHRPRDPRAARDASRRSSPARRRRSARRRTRRRASVDLALPGVLPVLNGGAVRARDRFGLAVGARSRAARVFARKNYFYPDLPKGYQISQYEMPVVHGGTRRRRARGRQHAHRRHHARAPRGRRRQVAARGLRAA